MNKRKGVEVFDIDNKRQRVDPEAEPEVNWANLPRDIRKIIFDKVHAIWEKEYHKKLMADLLDHTDLIALTIDGRRSGWDFAYAVHPLYGELDLPSSVRSPRKSRYILRNMLSFPKKYNPKHLTVWLISVDYLKDSFIIRYDE